MRPGARQLEAGDFDYAPCYCEENVLRLLARQELSGLGAWAVAVFGPGPSVALCRQKTGRKKGGLAFWDYHVFALVCREGKSRVLDFDTTMPFESPAQEYLAATFPGRAAGSAHGPYREALFRVMPGVDFERRFSSDRSHMRRADGSWIAPPPPWPCPHGSADGSRPLASVLSRSPDGPGRLLDLEAMMAFASDKGPT